MKKIQPYLRNIIEFGLVGGSLVIICHYLILFLSYHGKYSMSFLTFLLIFPFFSIPLLYILGKLYLKDYLEKWDSHDIKYLNLFSAFLGSLVASSLIIDLLVTMLNLDFIMDLGKGYDLLITPEGESVPQTEDSLKGFPLVAILFVQFIISYFIASLALTSYIRKKMKEKVKENI